MRRSLYLVGVVWLGMIQRCDAAETTLLVEPPAPPVSLFLTVEPARSIPVSHLSGKGVPRPPVYTERENARGQGTRWLDDAGFSLLEQRDVEGRRSYQVVSKESITGWTTVRVHARVGRPALSAGFDVRREVPALGVTVPWDDVVLELEGLNDRDMGWLVMARARWKASENLQYGFALPFALNDSNAVGVVFQLRLRFD